MVDVTNRPYWSRVWVIQEYLLVRDIEIFCGDQMIDWEHFQGLLCHKTGLDLPACLEFHVERYAVTNFKGYGAQLGALPLVVARHSNRYPINLQPLHDLIVHHRHSECTDSRDRVFALLGLIPPMERDLLSRYLPDYTLSADHVIIITLAHCTVHGHRSVVTPDSEALF